MSTTVSTGLSYESLPPGELARRLAKEIEETKTVSIRNTVYRVHSVSVRENRGTIVGWAVDWKTVGMDESRDAMKYEIKDEEDAMRVTIFVEKPGVVVAVGCHPTENRALIIYREG